MKINTARLLFAFFLLSTSILTAQQKDSYKPYYVTITKLYGNIDLLDKNWIDIEQKFFDDIILKNEYIKAHEILYNIQDQDLDEVLLVNYFESWDDIEKAKVRRNELIDEAWPDEEVRKAYFKKQNEHFQYYYSNQIYITTASTKVLNKQAFKNRNEPLTYYLVVNKLADYDFNDSLEAYLDYVNNVIYKNKFLYAYQTNKFYVGSDSRDYLEMFVANSYADLQKSFEESTDLLEQMIPDKEERDAFIEIYNAGVEGYESNVYKNVPSMSKGM